MCVIVSRLLALAIIAVVAHDLARPYLLAVMAVDRSRVDVPVGRWLNLMKWFMYIALFVGRARWEARRRRLIVAQ